MNEPLNDVKVRQDWWRIYDAIQKDAASMLETNDETGGERAIYVGAEA